MLDLINGFESISFIGMSKNAGKTTTLNYFIEQTRGKFILGLSSVGRDGETIDRVTSTSKPRIYIYAGTIIATCEACFKLCDATLEILEITGINTPMGRVLIARAISDGFVEIAGPSSNGETKIIMKKMKAHGANKIFIDGALSRKSLASPTVAEATLLSTGAALSNSMQKVISQTVFSYMLLNIDSLNEKEIADKIVTKSEKGTAEGISLIFDDHSLLSLELNTTIIGNEDLILTNIKENSRWIYTSGAITDSFVDALVKNTKASQKLTIIVNDGTKLFVNEESWSKLKVRKIKVLAMDKIKICGITVNPYSAHDYEMDGKVLLKNLKQHIDVPIFNVKEVSI